MWLADYFENSTPDQRTLAAVRDEAQRQASRSREIMEIVEPFVGLPEGDEVLLDLLIEADLAEEGPTPQRLAADIVSKHQIRAMALGRLASDLAPVAVAVPGASDGARSTGELVDLLIRGVPVLLDYSTAPAGSRTALAILDVRALLGTLGNAGASLRGVLIDDATCELRRQLEGLRPFYLPDLTVAVAAAGHERCAAESLFDTRIRHASALPPPRGAPGDHAGSPRGSAVVSDGMGTRTQVVVEPARE